MPQLDLTTAFDEQQYEMAYAPGIEYHWWNTARGAVIGSLVQAELGGDAVLLEVGCGKGLEVRRLRERGWQVFGVELADVTPLPELAQYVQSGTDATKLPLPQREQISAILLLDVIEHVPEPESFLKGLEEHFPNLRKVIVTVPARQEIWSNYDEFYGHFKRYSLGELGELAHSLNWREKRAGYFFQMLYLPARVLALFGVDRQTRIEVPGERVRWLHRWVARLNAWCHWLLPRRLWGTSAYAVFNVR